MPPRPQSPLRTHSAPLLPEPASVNNMNPYFCGWGGYTQSKEVSNHFGDRVGEDRRRQLSFSQGFGASRCQKQIDFSKTVEFPSRRRTPSVYYPTSRKTYALDGVCLTSTLGGKDHLQRQRPWVRDAATTTEATTTAVSMIEASRKEEHTIPPLPAAPTAYEAALAQYGKKLLNITQKQRHAKLRHDREVFNRLKAVNEKYNKLSRPTAVTTKGPEERSSGTNRGCKNTFQHRKDVTTDAVVVKTLRKEESAATTGIDPLCSLHNVASVARTSALCWEKKNNNNNKKKNKKNYSFCDMISTDSDDVNIKINIEDRKANGTLCVHSTRNGDTLSKQKSSQGAFVEYSSPYVPYTTSVMCRSEPLDGKAVIPVDDMFNNVRFLPPPCLTPPRPLRRTCGLGTCSYSPYENKQGDKSALRRYFPTQKTTHYEWGHRVAPTNEFCYERGNYNRNERCEKEHCISQQTFVFIRPQKAPRPLSRQRESSPPSNDKSWGEEVVSFSGPLWDNHADSGRPAAGLHALWNRKAKYSDGSEHIFTNIVPTYILDGFAQRHLLRMAWRRWRDRLWENKLSCLEGLKETVTTDMQDNTNCFADVRTWFAETTASVPML